MTKTLLILEMKKVHRELRNRVEVCRQKSGYACAGDWSVRAETYENSADLLRVLIAAAENEEENDQS